MKQKKEQERISTNMSDLVKFLESNQYAVQKHILNREIQGPLMEVDRGCFKKDVHEKIQIANAKYSWEKDMKYYYGNLGLNWKKYNNTSNVLPE